jgi:hypothetical protein
MFTVKYCGPNHHETLTSADEIYYDPAIGTNGEYPRGQLECFNGEKRTRHVDGVVYVMNETGATVSKFNLGGYIDLN